MFVSLLVRPYLCKPLSFYSISKLFITDCNLLYFSKVLCYCFQEESYSADFTYKSALLGSDTPCTKGPSARSQCFG